MILSASELRLAGTNTLEQNPENCIAALAERRKPQKGTRS